MKKILIFLVLITALFLVSVYMGWLGQSRHVEKFEGSSIPEKIITQRTSEQINASKNINVNNPKQILFGDFHVHTTFSTDAFWWSLPILGGEGVHPMADACDYARYCSSIDFWAITDHAEASTPRKWKETKDFIRQCSFKSGEESNDVIPFIGFEWTQVLSLIHI